VLFYTGIYEEPNDGPAIEGEIEIAGKKHTALLVPQPIPHYFEWDDDGNTAELYDVNLNDLGTGNRLIYHFTTS
jgi:hypothetical protein